jgi:elongator complex protein 2
MPSSSPQLVTENVVFLDLNHWVPKVSISGHFGSVESLVWDPQSLFVVTASLDQTCRVFAPWNRKAGDDKASTWHEMGRSQIHGYDMQCVSFIDKWRYVSGADEKVNIDILVVCATLIAILKILSDRSCVSLTHQKPLLKVLQR